jgi:glycosyltransferase involved in cell wall biosynthesis
MAADPLTQEKELISVIVPVYNCQDSLHRCLDSIRGQSYRTLEVLLINDGSTDDSGAICDEFARADDRIRVFHGPNSGPAAARNLGIEQATGSLLFFLDADDDIEKNALQLLVESYQASKADLIVGDFKKNKDGHWLESGHDAVLSSSKLLTKHNIQDYTKSYLRKPNRFPLFVYSWGRLFKSSIIKEHRIRFNAGLRTFEDVLFNFIYLKHANDMFFVNEPIYNHLVHENYASASMMISGNPEIMFGYKEALVAAGEFIAGNTADATTREDIGHAYVCYTIIQLVRICGQLSGSNKKKIYKVVRETVNETRLRTNLQFYSPSKGDSKMVPLLMKLRLVWPVIAVCRYKANKRYRKKKVKRDETD